jgi:hypothetical protein
VGACGLILRVVWRVHHLATGRTTLSLKSYERHAQRPDLGEDFQRRWV